MLPLSVELELLRAESYGTLVTMVKVLRAEFLGIEVEPMALGVILRAESELELERVVDRFRQVLPEVHVGALRVEYMHGSQLFEPFAKVQLQVSGTDVERVTTEALSRRATSIEVAHETVSFDAPYAELFGYSTAVRILTRGTGSIRSIRLLEYRVAPRLGGEDGCVHA